jgi:two-component system sensor histidine kinase YesM
LYNKFDDERYLGGYELNKVSNNRGIIRNIGGRQALVTVQDFKKLNWKIISIVPLNEITNEKRGMTKLIVIFGAICLLCAFIVSYLISYTISKPILKLVSIMKEIKSGNLMLRADLNAKGEIGMLGDGFNSLMDKINVCWSRFTTNRKQKGKVNSSFSNPKSNLIFYITQLKPSYLLSNWD